MSPGPATTGPPPTPPPFCREGSIRTISSNYTTNRSIYGTLQRTSEFRFEVCTGDQYASICDVGWDDRDAAVVCRNIGFFDNVAVALQGLAFSEQEEIYGIQAVRCNGTEDGLEQCQNSTTISEMCSGDHVAGVRCIQSPRPCYPGDVRQINLTYSSMMVNREYLTVLEGSFELCIGGYNGPVCDIGWDDVDATVLCRRIQGDNYVGEAIPGYGYSDSYIAQDLRCNGTEYELRNCNYTNATERCNGQHVAGFRCREIIPPCSDGNFRFTNQTFVYDTTNFYYDAQNFSAQVEVCVNGSFVAFCDSGFALTAAEIACRYQSSNYRPPFYRAEVLTGAFTDYYSGSVYSGRLNCSGNEYSLNDCQLTPGNDQSCAANPSRAVGFRCVRELVECSNSDGSEFRLLGGQTNYFTDSGFRATGRVDVCFNRTFGSVCSQGWDERDAMAFCRYQFGAGTMGRVTNGSEFGISPIGNVLFDIKCSGNRNERISECTYGQFGRFVSTLSECSGVGSVAGVICTRECDSGYARLVGGEAYYEGLVEACVNNRWMSICDIGWDDVDASVVCRSIRFFFGGEAINSSAFGVSSLPFSASNVQCFGREYTIGDCRNESIIPTECTASRVAAARCVPGLIVMEIVSRGVPQLGSSGYTVQCNAVEYPWNAQLLRYRWNSTLGGELTSNNRLNVSLLNSTYDVYDRVFVFNSSIQFDPLTFQDAGYITCGLALNLTYPDGPNNSSTTIMNSTTSIITISVPPPIVTITTVNQATVDQPYTATCMASFVAAVPMHLVRIVWMDEEGAVLTDVNNRIRLSDIRQISDSTYTREVTVNPVRIGDGGVFICEAVVMGEFITSLAASESLNIVVFAQAEVSLDQEIRAVLLGSSTSTGGNVTFVCSVFGSPRHPNATWEYIGPGSTTPMPLPDSITPVVTEISSTNLTSAITIQGVRFDHRGTYRCSAGTGLYDDVRLVVAVQPQLTITRGSSSSSLTEEDSLALTCSASDYYPRTSITWFKNTNSLSRTSRIEITELTSMNLGSGLYTTQSSLNIASTRTTDSGAYYCKAILRVDGLDQLVPVRVDGNISIQVQARNECIISRSDNGVVTPCVNGYCVDSVGDYLCVCLDTYQGKNCSVPVVIEVPPTITSPPTSQSYRLGDTANITCAAVGQPTPTFRWFFNNEEVNGEIFPYLIIPSIEPENRGTYYCIVTNRAGSLESNRAVVTIEGVQQFSLAFNEPSRRKRQSDTVQMFINSLSGTPIGDTGVTIYAAAYQPGPPASILATLNAGESGEFPETGLADSLQAAANGVASQFGIAVTGVKRFDGCPAQVVDGFMWPESDLSLVGPVAVSCSCGSLDTTAVSLQATRNCTGSYEGGAMWAGNGDSDACRFSRETQNLCAISSEPTEVAIASVLALTQNRTAVVDSTSVTIAVSILSQNTSALQSATVREEVVNSLSNLQDVDRTTLQESQNNAQVTNLVINLVENLADSLPLEGETGTSIIADNGELSVAAIAPDVNNFQGLSFDVNFNPDGSIKTAHPSSSASSEAPTSISIPSSIISDVGINSDELTDFKVAFSVFTDDSLFLPRLMEAPTGGTQTKSRYGIGSSVISAQILDDGVEIKVDNLNNPILVELAVKPFSEIPYFADLKEEDYDRRLTCVFWDPTLDSGYGGWSTDGCKPFNEASSKAICECDHLTSFALLMDVSPREVEPSPEIFALEIITYVGLAVSILGLLLTIITYLVVKKLRQSDVGKMLLNLCFALLGLYVAFLISTSAESLQGTQEGRNICGFFSALLHYFMLAYFFWTAAEAFFLFLKLVKVQRGSMNAYVYVAMAICWAVPVAIVGISLAGYQYYLSSSFCRPTEWPFWFGFIAPFALIYIFNWVMFVAIMVALCMHTKRTAAMSGKDTNVKSMIAKHLLIAAVLSLLFGLGWAFGLIGTSSLPREVHLPAQYIFSIFMGTQGILMFLLHAVRSPDAREEWKRWWYIITCRSDSYYLKRHASMSVTRSTSGKAHVTSLEGSTSIAGKSGAFDEDIPLAPKDTKDSTASKEMAAAVDTSTTVENVYTIDPTEDDGEPVKVDLSSDAGKESQGINETSKL